ncbi:MAG: hypothetical protein AUJ49_05380, partial [Desulfovibrionaceae bacterium CG1_02_65_16]
SRLPPLLAAPPDLPDRDEALAVEMRRLALGPTAAPALLPAARTEPETLGLVLADMLRSGGAQAAASLRLLPLLPRLGVRACMDDLPPKAHALVLARIFGFMAAAEPEGLARAVKALDGGLTGSLDTATARDVAAFFAAPSPVRAGGVAASPFNRNAWKRPPAPPGGSGKDSEAKQAKGRAQLAEILHSPMLQLKDRLFNDATVSGGVIEGALISGGGMLRCRFSGVAFRRVRISAATMALCLFEDCSFEDCVFAGTDLSHSRFAGCRLSACAFEAADASRTMFAGCGLTACAFADASLAGALLEDTRLEECAFRACALSGLTLRGCRLTRITLLRTDASGGLWENCRWREGECRAGALDHARLLDCECLDLTIARTTLTGLTAFGGHTNSPDLWQAWRATRARLLEGVLAKPAPLPAGLAAGTGAALLAACVEARLRVEEAEDTLAAMRGQNQRRRELAMERLGEEQGLFVRLLPTLLETDVFERAQRLDGIPACVIAAGESPGATGRPAAPARETLAQLERLFPGLEPPRQRAPAVRIEAVYAIGSLGSVAQKPSSDVDCWILLAPPILEPGAAGTARARLARKLEMLERWATERFGLEVHFFLMDLDTVRRNDFGISDRESSGSAQAALLKEEFYRTALKLAGRDLLWWAAPPAAGQAEAETLAAELARLAPRTAAELLDLGQPLPIPEEEYFGACLWQMVKALHSPYKSVMKLGLLEKYAGQGEEMRLLCDRIKEAVMRGRSLLSDVDPYLSLFTSIRKHYLLLDDATSLALIGECLRLKADVAPQDLPEEFGADAARHAHIEDQPARAGASSPFEAALRLGGMVSLFMVQAYRRIQEDIREGRAARITPEDMTRLGRRIAANFSQQQGKVGLVPFLVEDLGFSEFSFGAEKTPGKRPIWTVKGRDKAAGKTPVEALPPIRRDVDVARLLAWLHFNGLYGPGAVLAEKTLAPIALADLQLLLADMAAFFPRRDTLEPDLDEYLRPERVTRCYLIVNLPTPPDKNKILTLSALYATNWGEVFVQTIDNPPQMLVKCPLAYLREVLDKSLPDDCAMRVFTPKRAACPRLKVL